MQRLSHGYPPTAAVVCIMYESRDVRGCGQSGEGGEGTVYEFASLAVTHLTTVSGAYISGGGESGQAGWT